MSRRVSGIFFLLFLPFGVTVISSCGPAGQQDTTSTKKQGITTTDTYYHNGDYETEIALALDRLALLTESEKDVSKSRVEEYAANWDLTVAQYEPSRSILATADAQTRNDLAMLIRDIRDDAESREWIRGVGLWITQSDGTPANLVVTDKFVANFKEGVTQAEIEDFNANFGTEIVSDYPISDNEYVLKVTATSEGDAIEVANAYHEHSISRYAHPDPYLSIEHKTTKLNDTYFGDQWHHQNTSGGTYTSKDADVDTTEAFDDTKGSSSVSIGIIELSGIEHDHPDLKPNRYVNSSEKGGSSGVDDDSNGYIDDKFGLDFVDPNNHNPLPLPKSYCSISNWDTGHGTSVTGLAAAAGNNSKGIAGTCPKCRFVPVRLADGKCSVSCARASQVAKAINYTSEHAEVISNSWGHKCSKNNGTVTCNITRPAKTVRTAVQNASASGDVVIWSAGNLETKKFCTQNSYPAMKGVLNVSGSNKEDARGGYATKHAIGDCVDVLAPSCQLWTTERSGSAGCGVNPSGTKDYRLAFCGTSGAAPLVAGVAGLLQSINSNISSKEIRNILRDTADKIQPSTAAYSSASGKSDPSTGPSTHAYGRVNAHEGVKAAKKTTDVFMRDHSLDWGNTDQRTGYRFTVPDRSSGPWWESADIKVDAKNSNGNYQTPPSDSSDFEALKNEDPIAGEINRVYVRIRNRGPTTAQNVKVKLFWAHAGTSLPNYGNLNSAQLNNTSGSTKSISNLPYSGASVAGSSTDTAKIIRFNWDAPSLPSSKKNPRHFCLVARAKSSNDQPNSTSGHISNLVPTDNNLTQDNIELNGTLKSGHLEGFFVRNPYAQSIETVVKIDKPKGWSAELDGMTLGDPITLEAGQEKYVELYMNTDDSEADVKVWQELVQDGENVRMGGMLYRFRSKYEGD